MARQRRAERTLQADVTQKHRVWGTAHSVVWPGKDCAWGSGGDETKGVGSTRCQRTCLQKGFNFFNNFNAHVVILFLRVQDWKNDINPHREVLIKYYGLYLEMNSIQKNEVHLYVFI